MGRLSAQCDARNSIGNFSRAIGIRSGSSSPRELLRESSGRAQ